MVFPVVGGDGKPTGYDIDNSLRFNDGDSPYLNRTFATPTNRKKFTFSAWYKRSTLSTTQYIISYDSGGLSMGIIGFSSTDKFIIYDRDSSSGSADIDYNTTQLFRDVSAWYHIVVSIDTTDGTSGDRVKIYVNGTRITSFDTSTAPAQNYDTIMNSAVSHDIGRWQAGSSYYDGYMSEINYVDGQALDSSYFGETDDNGVWIPKVYDGTYGNSGFFLEFKQTGTSANSSGMGADTSGNDNHFSATNLAATDVTTDTPTNNFCTLNPLSAKTLTFSEGNLHATNDGAAGSATGTIAPTNGKWYFEITLSGSANFAAGVVNLDDWPSGTDIYNYGAAAAVSIENNANYNITYGNTAASPSTLQTGTQLLNAKYGFAMDIDNNDLYVSANGNWYTGSAFDNTSFSSASAVTTDLPSNVPLTAFIRNPDTGSARCNFGNPAGADTISSGNADANGYGNFEYPVPSGFYSLCTKNLAEFG
jgi:hypothetical protein